MTTAGRFYPPDVKPPESPASATGQREGLSVARVLRPARRRPDRKETAGLPPLHVRTRKHHKPAGKGGDEISYMKFHPPLSVWGYSIARPVRSPVFDLRTALLLPHANGGGGPKGRRGFLFERINHPNRLARKTRLGASPVNGGLRLGWDPIEGRCSLCHVHRFTLSSRTPRSGDPGPMRQASQARQHDSKWRAKGRGCENGEVG
jgi:hypothetical protein